MGKVKMTTVNFKHDPHYQFDGSEKNVVRLDNGNYVFFHKDKYGSGLNFLMTQDQLSVHVPNMFKDDDNNFNLDYTGNLTLLHGRFFKSKKGSPFFDLTSDDKPHVLVRVRWGGAFDKSRGLKTVPDAALYYRRSKSNGGGLGLDYVVLPTDYQASYSVDDF